MQSVPTVNSAPKNIHRFKESSQTTTLFKYYLFSFPTVNAEHISCTGININTVVPRIVFCKYCSHRIESPYRSTICYKNQKHFNQFTMSLLFCVILFYMIFLVSAADLRSTTVGSKPTSTGRCEPVGTEQMSTGHLVVFASLRSVQSGHPLDVLHPCICPYQSS